MPRASGRAQDAPATPNAPSRPPPSREWRQRAAPPPDIAETLDLPPFQARLLYNRGIRRREEADAFLAGDSRDSHDPMLLPDMGKAVERLVRAVNSGEVIGIFGDFDTDGISGTALLAKALRELGATVVPYLPDRVNEGHGLNTMAVGVLRGQGVSLLVTVDCGSSSVDEIELASALGIETIVTDHHSLPSSLPQAAALVNSNRLDSRYPYGELTGAGLSFKLVQALWAALRRPSPDHLLELAALGTVADVAPLTGENRYVVKRGLERLNNTENPGLRALMARAGVKRGAVNSESLSFSVIPRLNAAGRLGHASLSLELLLADSAEVAEPIAERLEMENVRRRELTREGVDQAMRQIDPGPDNPPPILIVESEDWLPGILGLIASNISERYYRPAAAVLVGEEVSRASMRSIPEFDVVEALNRSHGLFHHYGGHPRAAGFTLSTSDLPSLKSDLMLAAEEKLGNRRLRPAIDVDFEVPPRVFDDANLEFMQSMEPYGEGNRAPVFLTRGFHVARARRVGQQSNHLKMTVVHEGRAWDAIAFNLGDRPVAAGGRVDLVYNVGLNHWGGVTTTQLGVLDLRAAG